VKDGTPQIAHRAGENPSPWFIESAGFEGYAIIFTG
jgi:hypothetical protein